MARIEDIPQPMRDAVLAVPCPSFETRPFVAGPELAQRRVAIVSSAALIRRGETPFTAVDKVTRGMRTLPVVEKYGIMWVCPTPTAKLDIDGLLDELGDEFAGYGFDSYPHYETRVLHRHINWKPQLSG